MKKLLTLTAAGIFALSFNSCDKKDDDKEQTNQEKLVGTWNVTSQTTTLSRMGMQLYSDTSRMFTSFEVKDNNTAVFTMEGQSQTADFSILNDSMISTSLEGQSVTLKYKIQDKNLTLSTSQPIDTMGFTVDMDLLIKATKN